MPDEVIRIHDEFYILSTSASMDDRTLVLKHADAFCLVDRFGDIEVVGRTALGLYNHDTRFLSRFALRLGSTRPLLLSSTIREDNSAVTVDLTNPDIARNGEVIVPRGTIHLLRSVALWEATGYQLLQLHNYGRSEVSLSLSLDFAADFSDLFEVRGLRRTQRGSALPAEVDASEVLFGYEGLDGRLRRTRIRFDPPPTRLTGSQALLEVQLAPGEEATYQIAIRCEIAGPGVPSHQARRGGGKERLSFEEASNLAAEALRSSRADEPDVFTANEQFNDWLNRSIADLYMMQTETVYGPYPYAGVPWFSTAFGRDGIITALECLWFDPRIARGVLSYLAATQADENDPARDAQPGKILHETRGGEMAATGEVPFRLYYGSVDATPLFIVLAARYYERTADLAFIRSIWPQVERALSWIDRYGDVDGDGFVEYERRSEHGLVHQGWKDSQDAIFHADGELADGPIAVCEVQGYVYDARVSASLLARLLGHEALSVEQAQRARRLRERFEETFWCEDLSTYALALDGRKRLCRVRASNAGHCLFSGIAGEDRARRVAAELTGGAYFSGWGVRTTAAGEARYNPMSYHNGSVWPHDNALIAGGCARYGLVTEATKILAGLFDASLFLDLHRLPELFCGFPRRAGEKPTLYPVSCSPQTWASASVFLALQACLGLHVVASEGKIVFTKPSLPPFLTDVSIRGLRVGNARADVCLARRGDEVEVEMTEREGSVEVVVAR